MVFGMEMVELPAKEKRTLKEKQSEFKPEGNKRGYMLTRPQR